MSSHQILGVSVSDEDAKEPKVAKVRKPLSPRQLRFVAEYVVDLKASTAAIRAGYSPDSAESEGPKLLQIPRIRNAIAAEMSKRSIRTNITADRVVAELEALSFSDVTHYLITDSGQIVLSEGAPKNAMKAIQSIKRKTYTKDDVTHHEVEIKLWDKPGPLKLAGRHVNVAGFFDKVELTGKDGQPLNMPRVTFMMPDNGRGPATPAVPVPPVDDEPGEGEPGE